uniref:Uncharacterized protein n=1 Tax=Anguilla anguilla TaxID=7936 RepID=A0A0E9TN57_ANGAN
MQRFSILGGMFLNRMRQVFLSMGEKTVHKLFL